jgi:hypothetical protein
MEDLFQYWRELGLLCALAASATRVEMLGKNNAARIEKLEEKLDSSKTNEWVEFKAITRLKIDEHDKEIRKLFNFHDKGR